MEYHMTKQGEVTIITCRGRMDANSSPQFKDYLKSMIEEGNARLIIAMDSVDFLDSSGLGALVACLRKAADKKGEIKLSGLAPEVRAIFDMTKVSRLFDIRPDISSAMQAFEQRT